MTATSQLLISLLMAVMMSVSTLGQDVQDTLYPATAVLDIDAMTSEDSLRVDGLVSRAQQLFDEGLEDSAAYFADQAITISRNLNFRQGKAEAYKLKAEIEKKKGRLPLAVRNYFSALREFEWMGDSLSMADINTRIGELYMEVELYRKAIEYLRKSEPVYASAAMEEKVYHVKSIIADALLNIEDYESALKEYLLLLEYFKARQDQSLVLDVISRIVLSYHELDRYEQSMQYSQMALQIYESSADNHGKLVALNNIGFIYKYLGDHEQSIIYFKKVLELIDEMPSIDSRMKTACLTNLAVVYQNMGEYSKAKDNLFQAISILDEAGDKAALASANNLLANVFFLDKDYHNALVYSEVSVRHARQSNREILSEAYLTRSKIYTALYDYEESMNYYQQYLQIRDTLEREEQARRTEYIQQEFLVERTERDLELIVADDEIQDQARRNLVLDTIKKRQQLELLRKTNKLQEAAIENQRLELARQEQQQMLIEAELEAVRRDKEIWELKVTEQEQRDSIERIEHRQQLTVKENEILKKDNELQQETLSKIRARNRFLFGIVLLALAIGYMIYRSLRYARKVNRQLTDQRNKIQQQKEALQSQYEIIERERAKSDKLLLNILPEEIAAELKEKGSATPRNYEKVSVLFTDFVGFTRISERLSAKEIIKSLDFCFMEFDRIIERHNLEKIKTIGDAYMCAGGIPVANDTNAADTVSAALEIRDFMSRIKQEKEAQGADYWEMRIGVNTGPVVAGVVGKSKFAYDIWGDAVNTASRMESSGEAGAVNISGGTYELGKDLVECTYRGKVKAKNKGEIDMYFVERKKP